MQLSTFYCNWKTIHHRNFMVGLGESVIYNKWWNSLSLAIWLHVKNARCKYGRLQSNTVRSLKFGWSHLPPHCSFRWHQRNWTSLSLLYGSPFVFMILAVSYRKYRKKNWLLKNYYSSQLSFGHVGLLASKGQTTLSIDSKPLGLLIALSLLFLFFLL